VRAETIESVSVDQPGVAILDHLDSVTLLTFSGLDQYIKHQYCQVQHYIQLVTNYIHQQPIYNTLIIPVTLRRHFSFLSPICLLPTIICIGHLEVHSSSRYSSTPYTSYIPSIHCQGGCQHHNLFSTEFYKSLCCFQDGSKASVTAPGASKEHVLSF
jgi:hypothetical protein